MTRAGALPAGASLVRGDEAGLVSVRRAEAADREALARMFDRCTPQTRYRRFHGPIKAIPGRYLADALSGSTFHYALVACLEPDPASAADPAPFADPDVRAGGIVALASSRMVDEGAAAQPAPAGAHQFGFQPLRAGQVPIAAEPPGPVGELA